ncbi:MAG: hypothetical protein CO144_02070 [Candidatus Nealsonbacteria bacterium CG_4_9_14_3_um_filter_35_11]|nr:MAG: hypothetical protein COZ88_02185 [Candidatus Nealsonbacteria bacterium CG_4_8_14_3_um_filter_34_13]PJA84375.1 MAG: hypothetical protein CO144_02070 [Candidatus Nealsonbacteria bacterium CG_4_9_14_3_um_filter_35_11]
MKQKLKDQRVAVLIDVQNMYYSARNLYRKKVNFKEVLKTAQNGRKLIRALAYVIKTETQESETFFQALVRAGIEVKMKDLQIFPGGLKKGDWDVGIAMDAVRLSSSVDTIILVSGDGDFIPLVEYIKYARPSGIEVIGFGRTTSGKLKEMADDYFDLEQSPQKYLIP